MVFSSITFLLYFLPLFLTCYLLSPLWLKNIVVLVFSILFYSWGAPLFIFVILGTTLIDFYLVKLMHASTTPSLKKLFLILSVGMNVGLLFYFKYSFFAIENLNHLLHISGATDIVWQKVALPIGISFFTFESLTYVIDVYRGEHEPLKNFWNYQLYIILFPKLIAGPIVRYNDIADQITGRFANENIDKVLSGLYRFIIGLTKKVIIANSLAVYADRAFQADVHTLSCASAWIGILCYTFQIYFDFSGYSDMAIGLLRIMGFSINENFNQPYTANSITDFWRRWHISLGAWMRNYLYIPLGGNRVNSQFRLYFNLWIVFLASGLWHGASWTFVIWGAYHGLWLVLERAFVLKYYQKLWNPLRVAITFLIVLTGWVFFRADTLHQAVSYLQRMYMFDGRQVFELNNDFVCIISLACIFSFIGIVNNGRKLIAFFYNGFYNNIQAVTLGIVCLALLIIDIGSLAIKNFNPFIYFRF